MTSPVGSDDSEDRDDFNLLQCQLSNRTSLSPTSTASTNSTNEEEAEVWPLQLRPTFVGHYIIGEAVGAGSYAEVRESINTRTLERCVLKIVNKNYLKKQAPKALANQLQEIRLLKRLNHINIISMRECFFVGTKIYIALEYCSFVLNELLEERCASNGNKLEVLIARNFFYQLCCGLNYLHSFGIVHRDIKPQNLLITNCGTLKIIDFGVSHILSMWSQEDFCSNYEGSPLFQAPEVVCGQKRYSGFKVDVWSAGVTLYLMLYGKYPFMDEALLGLYDKILGENFDIPSGPPTQLALVDLLMKLLEKNHTKRATIEQILKHSWLKLRAPFQEADDELNEFVELVTTNTGEPDAGYASSPMRDMHKSMSVLPYLYKHHFPNLPITKANKSLLKSPSLSPENKRLVLNEISPSASPSGGSSPASTISSGTEEAHNNDEEEHTVEWGTREQYRLLKVPPIRANRVGHRRRRRPRRNSSTNP